MYNQITIVGNLGADSEVTHFTGASKLVMRVATTSSYKNKQGEWVEDTVWHVVEVWNPSQFLCDNTRKGIKVLCAGQQRNESYQDKDGNTKYRSFIKSETVRILSRPEASTRAEEAPAYSGTFSDDPAGSNDLPF